MKVRIGFVSNSSSTSYVIHKSEIGEENFNKLIAGLEKFRIGKIIPFEDYEYNESTDEVDTGWGDSEATFTVFNNYIWFDCHNIRNPEFFKLLKRCGMNPKNTFHVEGVWEDGTFGAKSNFPRINEDLEATYDVRGV